MDERRYFSDGTIHIQVPSGNRRVVPVKVKGKARVKAAKRTRTYNVKGERTS